jgi:hypothetical protein
LQLGGRGAFSYRRRVLVSLVLTALAVLLAALATSASAVTTHVAEPFSPIDGSGSGLTFDESQGLAIDEAAGNLFVTDGGTGHERIAIVDDEGGPPAALLPPFAISGLPYGINSGNPGLAYDNSPSSSARGTLYAYDQESATIKKYVRGSLSERYEASGEITIPLAGKPAGGLSVDAQGNVWVGTSVTRGPSGEHAKPPTVYELSSAGALLHEYELPEPPGHPVFEGTQEAVVDAAGDLFVPESGGVYEFPASGSGEIDPSVYKQISSSPTTGVAVDRTGDRLYAAQINRVAEFDADSGDELTHFGSAEIGRTAGIAFDGVSGRIYVADSSTETGGHGNVNVFSAPVVVPTTNASAASNITATKATLNGSINPEGLAIEECFFEYGPTASYGHTAPCSASVPTDSEPHPVSADVAGLESDGATYHFRLVAKNENGVERSGDKSFLTATTVATEAATVVEVSTAILNGAVRPEGAAFTACKFEYGLVTSATFETEVPCHPGAGEIDPDFALHNVTAPLAGLQANATYRFRLTATNASGTLSGEVMTFTTIGNPQIGEIRTLEADQSSAALEAEINPRGFGTSYRFEWGPTAAYGHSVPADFEPYIGEGTAPVRVTASLSGLSPETAYHYRVVATSTAGITASPDQEVETLDSCGLPEHRCLELVSPKEIGPVAAPGRYGIATENIHYQAAPEGPGSLAYTIEGGLPNATRSSEVLYRGNRSGSWTSSQIDAPITSRNEVPTFSSPAAFMGLAPDLSCGVLRSSQPLTSDPAARLQIESGGQNLYRLNQDGTFTLVSNLPPENPGGQNEYQLIGMSADCERIVFDTGYHYPGVAGAGDHRLYEWSGGTLKGIGLVPGEGGSSVPVEAEGGGGAASRLGAVSQDGAKVFFSADRVVAGNQADPEEVGKLGVFVRENGTSTHDVSASDTGIPDLGAEFQGATPDGSRVYFTANAGLTSETSAAGTDLYEYDLETSTLSDRSADHEAGGASVGGVLGFADDGSHVYFAARGQLDPGRGNSSAQNQSGHIYSIYDASAGGVDYAGAITDSDLAIGGVLRSVGGQGQPSWRSRVSPDGRYLLFESGADVTGYDNQGTRQTYVYSAGNADEPIVCISCRTDKGAPIAGAPFMLQEPTNSNPLYAPLSLVVHGGKPEAFFVSLAPLAKGAVEGESNLYEWAHGQVFLIARQPAGASATPFEAEVVFTGASANGSDLYFFDAAALNWENPQGRYAVWDARENGGFAQPAAPAPGCQAAVEGSCQAAGGQGIGGSSPATSAFVGSGNLLAPLAPVVVPRTSKLTRAQQLAKARAACRKYKVKARRLLCEKHARSKYGVKSKAKAKPHSKAQPKKGAK